MSLSLPEADLDLDAEESAVSVLGTRSGLDDGYGLFGFGLDDFGLLGNYRDGLGPSGLGECQLVERFVAEVQDRFLASVSESQEALERASIVSEFGDVKPAGVASGRARNFT